MDLSKFERMYQPKVSNSLPTESGVYLKCKYKPPLKNKYSKPEYIEGIIYLVPQNQREEPWVTEYNFKPIDEVFRNFNGIIRGIYIRSIDQDYVLIKNDTMHYLLQDSDGKFD